MKTRHKHVYLEPDRHGKLRARFRKGGKQVYMKTIPDQPGFDAELKALMEDAPAVQNKHIHRSVNDGLARYYRCGDFAAKGGPADKRRRRGLLESFRRDFGNDLVSDFTFEHIEAILIARTAKRVNDKGRVVGGEVAAVALRKQLRRFFAHMKKLGWITTNPVEEAEKIGKNKISGRHTWTEEQIAQYKARHPLGTKARLALEIFLWTWQRRGDARLFGPKHIVNDKIMFTASKNAAELAQPLAPDLRRAIEAMPAIGIKTFLVTEYGQPFTVDGFGNWFAARCDEAGLPPECRAHGLRKAGGRRGAQAHVSQQGLKAVGGWKGDQEVAIYTAAVEQEGLAVDAMARVVAAYSDTKDSENV